MGGRAIRAHTVALRFLMEVARLRRVGDRRGYLGPAVSLRRRPRSTLDAKDGRLQRSERRRPDRPGGSSHDRQAPIGRPGPGGATEVDLDTRRVATRTL